MAIVFLTVSSGMRCSRNAKSYGRGGYCTGDPKLDNFIVGDGGRIAATDFEFAEPFSPHIAREEEAANLVPGFISSDARSIARMYREKEPLRAIGAMNPAKKNRAGIVWDRFMAEEADKEILQRVA